MGKIPVAIRYVAFALLVISQHSLVEATDLSGKWTGKTVCPLGPVSFTVDVKDRAGTFSHGGYGPDKVHPTRFPVAIRTKTGWEGEWVYFEKPGQSARNYQSFGSISGLLSTDGRTLSVRGIGIGDCREFKLTRATVPRSQPSTSVAGHPKGREPTGEEMRAAIEYLVGDISNPGITLSINEFRKLGCVPAKGRLGYFCKYTLSLSYNFRHNVHDDLFKAIIPNLPEETASGRFLYDNSKNRWVRFNE